MNHNPNTAVFFAIYADGKLSTFHRKIPFSEQYAATMIIFFNTKTKRFSKRNRFYSLTLREICKQYLDVEISESGYFVNPDDAILFILKYS